MSEAIHAVYENGSLRLLEPTNLTEGQHIQLVILSERELARTALASITAQTEPDEADDIDEAALLAEIDTATKGNPSVSDAIIEERREGP